MQARSTAKFDIAKKVFPHYFCGRDDTDHVILLQRPGLMNIKLASNNQMTGEDLLYHYVYVMEYLWRIIEDDVPSATMTSIIDLTGLNISILRKREQMRIGSLFLSTMDAHFPQRSHQTLLINAPKWFGALYKIASPLLRESTKQKIQILSKGPDQDRILQQLLSKCPTQPDDDEDDIGGTTSTTQTQTQQHEDQYENVPAGIMEEELRNFVSLYSSIIYSVVAISCVYTRRQVCRFRYKILEQYVYSLFVHFFLSRSFFLFKHCFIFHTYVVFSSIGRGGRNDATGCFFIKGNRKKKKTR